MERSLNVLFVRPKPSPETIGLQHIMVVEPLELEILATLIKADNQVTVIDMIHEKKPISYFIHKYDPDVFCITGYITHTAIMAAYCRIAKEINPKTVTVTGGIHIEKFPEDIDHEYVDFRVVRNATITFPKLIDHIKGNADLPNGVLSQGEILDEALLPEYDFYTIIPDRTLTSKYRKKYFYVFHNKVALLKTSFGCPYKCNFCYCRIITGGKYFARPIDIVIKELKTIKEKEIYIIDDDFLLEKGRLKEFIRLVKLNGINKNYLVFGRADFIADNPNIIHEFKSIGLRTVLVGLESFNNDELSGYKKQTSESTNKLALKVLSESNVDCYAAVILSPTWSQEDFNRAADIMVELGLKFINLQPLTPLKGTGLYIDEDTLIIDRSDFSKWDLAHIMVKPHHMTVSEYYNNIIKLYQRVIFKPKHLWGYIKYSPLMQYKIIKGLIKIRKQYRKKIMEGSHYAKNTIYSTDSVQRQEQKTL
ncbi:B12-binding domain-containing radical SAM protein [Saccharicrinis sp. 156]|uniref:B12-binding domain-containing radical SAM protein n=1 Tax=Saccharicrinis sp. 156 TaxID=3417574 RepID=UPI003D3588B7